MRREARHFFTLVGNARAWRDLNLSIRRTKAEFQLTPSPFVALTASSLLAAGGQVMMKLGATGASNMTDFLNFRIASGLTAYGVSTALWIWALSKVPLNIAYGFTALTFLIVFVASGAVLRESFSLWIYLGLTLVLGGFLCLALPSAQS